MYEECKTMMMRLRPIRPKEKEGDYHDDHKRPLPLNAIPTAMGFAVLEYSDAGPGEPPNWKEVAIDNRPA